MMNYFGYLEMVDPLNVELLIDETVAEPLLKLQAAITDTGCHSFSMRQLLTYKRICCRTRGLALTESRLEAR